jgi:hypothetical protein
VVFDALCAAETPPGNREVDFGSPKAGEHEHGNPGRGSSRYHRLTQQWRWGMRECAEAYLLSQAAPRVDGAPTRSLPLAG